MQVQASGLPQCFTEMVFLQVSVRLQRGHITTGESSAKFCDIPDIIDGKGNSRKTKQLRLERSESLKRVID
jgi:hypothetical protein